MRFVTINTFLTVFDEITWDIHGSKPFTSIEGMRDIVCPMYDQAYTALLEDLVAAGHARYDAGLQPGRVRPHAAGEPRRRARPLAALLHRRLRRRRRQGRPGRRRQRPDRRRARPTGPSSRPTSPPRSSTAWASTSKPSSPGRPGGRSRWSTSAIARSTSSSESTPAKPLTTASRHSPRCSKLARHADLLTRCSDHDPACCRPFHASGRTGAGARARPPSGSCCCPRSAS